MQYRVYFQTCYQLKSMGIFKECFQRILMLKRLINRFEPTPACCGTRLRKQGAWLWKTERMTIKTSLRSSKKMAAINYHQIIGSYYRTTARGTWQRWRIYRLEGILIFFTRMAYMMMKLNCSKIRDKCSAISTMKNG